MPSMFEDTKRTWFENFGINTLKCGPIPQHIAIIMDGNRRYARNLKLPAIEGHRHGFKTMIQMSYWCRDLGIKELSAYAFSIENFNRPEEEVSGLLQLMREKIQALLDDIETIEKNGVRYKIYGKLSLLPVDIQELINKLEHRTKDYNMLTLNMYVSYTSREEMTAAVRELAYGVEHGFIEPGDINTELYDRCMYASDSSPPDLLIRTSGERRLSDFLLWQTSFTILSFVGISWPELSIWKMFLVILFYQHHYPAQQAAIRAKDIATRVEVPEQDCLNRRQKFLEDLQKRRLMRKAL